MNIFLSSFGDYSDSSSSSETSSSEVILASARPKKRAGRRVFKETRHPVYRGVRRRNNNKWVCEMRVPNINVNKNNKSRIWLGTYPTPEMAARAHDVAALTLKGKSACLNFADSAWRLTLPESNDAVEIRRAAMEAAKMFAIEENHNQRSDRDAVDMNMENSKKNVLEVQVPVLSSEFEDMHHNLLLSIANEPLRSNPPSPTNYYGSNYDDMEIFDTQIVSLWNFSI
ncbi:putative transcription factor AP2-EREBP family [Medicago truncatula]|uniref:Dehydration-responsive element-binding protein n=1 Tax=Medicago truncatula TaxID=3880 RepID=G7KDI0_MEDTR|nr:dehydration-responsive element-binding protein 1E [Medicago truncatula]AES94115.1 dehydration-responsive element-binding protein [Medicago truncatula]AFK45314.1 unknown [Medicago truncatula]RHN53645.1 putative transcription factor AP2-EREBP family [Medicago truncatula]